MPSRFVLSVAAGGLALAMSGCALQADIAAGATAEACATLASLRSDVRALPRANSGGTVDDVRMRLAEIDRSLVTLHAQATGPARQLIVNLQERMSRSIGSMSDLSGDIPADSWPKSVRSAQRSVRDGFADVWTRFGCG